MTKRFYLGKGEPLSKRGLLTPLFPETSRLYLREGYDPEAGLVDAVHVSLTLGRPLLVTGPPGTGKTELAFSVASELELEPVLEFATKSTSVYTDLFYRYDTIRHFLDAQLKRERPISEYIDYGPMGEAVLLAMRRDDPACPEKYRGIPQRRSVVLIDEIDKAPRDFPNDILNEMDRMEFQIRETGVVYRASTAFRPILILTSNQEKDLPDAFRRRCAFYHIEFPSPTKLAEIVRKRLKLDQTFEEMLRNALAHFAKIRDLNLDKKPATAELLDWFALLMSMQLDVMDIKSLSDEQKEVLLFSYSVLAKSEHDLKEMRVAAGGQ